MKKTFQIFTIAFMSVVLSIGAWAQSTDNANILGKAEVLQGINVTGVTDLDFGRVSPGLSKTINLVNVASGGQVGEGTETTGVFTVSASSGTNVNIQFTTLPANLVDNATTPNNLAIGAYTAAYGLVNPNVGGTTFTPGTATQVNGGNFPTNAIGSENAIYVFIGGTVTPTVNQPSGDYQASITLTATYN